MTTRLATSVVALATVMVGSLVAVGASFASLQPYAKRSSAATTMPLATPPAAATPAPAPMARGQLGAHPRLVLSGDVLLASGDNVLFESDDAGATFRSVSLPAGASGLVVAPSDPRRRLTGGTSLRVSDDGGGSWRLPAASPPGPGPFTSLAISLSDRDVWFVAAHGRLLRTRDGGISWREMAAISTDSGTLVIPTGRPNEFVVSSGGQIYEFSENGQQTRTRPALPSPTQPLEVTIVETDPTITLLVRGSDGKDYLDAGGGWQTSLPLAGPVAAIPGKFMVIGDGAGASTPAATEASSDLGKTWSEGQGLPARESLDAFGAMPGGSAVYAYTYGGTLFKSADGINWIRLSGALES